MFTTKTGKLMIAAILSTMASSPLLLNELNWKTTIGLLFGAVLTMFKRDTDAKIERAVNGR